MIPVVPPSNTSDSLPNDGIEVRIIKGGESETSQLDVSPSTDTTTHQQPDRQEDEYITDKTPNDLNKEESNAELPSPTKGFGPSNSLNEKHSSDEFAPGKIPDNLSNKEYNAELLSSTETTETSEPSDYLNEKPSSDQYAPGEVPDNLSKKEYHAELLSSIETPESSNSLIGRPSSAEYAREEIPDNLSEKKFKGGLPSATETSEPLDGNPPSGTPKKASPTKTAAVSNPQNGESSLPIVPTAKHKSFDNEDSLEAPLPTSENNKVFEPDFRLPPTVQVDEDSEDEAPETVSAETGLNQARIAATEVARLAEV